LGSLDLKRECGASLNARELTREKKVDMDDYLSRHEGTQMTSILSISSWCFVVVVFFVCVFVFSKYYENRAVFL